MDHAVSPQWRLAAIAQWHVTTLFIGSRPEDVLPHICSTIGRIAASQMSITLEQGRLVSMPKQDPSMLWIRFRPSHALTALHVALAEATGTDPSVYRPYWPHITLARAKSGHSVHVDGPVLLERFVIDQLTLFRSSPSPTGSVHTPIESWALTRTSPIDPGVVV